MGMAGGASAKAVQRADRRKALEFHPDRAGPDGDKEYFTKRFIEVKEAYETLREEGFPGPPSEDILEEAGLADVSAGMVPALEQAMKNLKTVDIGPGVHFVQEDNPHTTGRELAKWSQGL